MNPEDEENEFRHKNPDLADRIDLAEKRISEMSIHERHLLYVRTMEKINEAGSQPEAGSE